MSTPPGEYYTEERWNNWLDRLREEEIDPESDDSARLFFNLLDDATIAVAKVVTDYQDGEFEDADAAVEELGRIREIVLRRSNSRTKKNKRWSKAFRPPSSVRSTRPKSTSSVGPRPTGR